MKQQQVTRWKTVTFTPIEREQRETERERKQAGNSIIKAVDTTKDTTPT
jgi:hypothetical protein